MGHAVVIYPELEDVSGIQELRRKYDPTFSLIAPHITLVFPTPDMDRDAVVEHVTEVLEDAAPFSIRLEGLTRSFDAWLFLCVAQGKEKVINLHDRLYAGIFRKHLRTDVPYIPHIGLGSFRTEKDFQAAEREARALNLVYESIVRSIYIIHLNDRLSRIDWTKELPLGQ